MKPPSEPTTIIGILTVIFGALMILRNLSDIISKVKGILNELRENVILRNQHQRQENEEYSLRITYWKNKLHSGTATQELLELTKVIEVKDGDSHA